MDFNEEQMFEYQMMNACTTGQLEIVKEYLQCIYLAVINYNIINHNLNAKIQDKFCILQGIMQMTFYTLDGLHYCTLVQVHKLVS